jgi:hypothetical protein
VVPGAGQQLWEVPGSGAAMGASGKKSQGQVRCGGSLGRQLHRGGKSGRRRKVKATVAHLKISAT